MSNSRRTLDRIRSRDALLAAGKLEAPSAAPVTQYPYYGARPFTIDDWRAERDVRETVDIYRMSIRWRVTVRVHGDSKAWQAYWVGLHDECLQRARILFQNPLSITLESAGIGGEMSDRWLPIITRSIAL